MVKIDTDRLLIICLSLLLPPVAVLVKKGLNQDFMVNCLLCVLMWLPGIVHALYVCMDDKKDYLPIN
eukprot:CFRG5215T1